MMMHVIDNLEVRLGHRHSTEAMLMMIAMMHAIDKLEVHLVHKHSTGAAADDDGDDDTRHLHFGDLRGSQAYHGKYKCATRIQRVGETLRHPSLP